MNLAEFQKWIGQFYEERGWSQYGPFIRMGFLAEESGELSRAVRALEIGRDRPDEEEKTLEQLREELIEEVGDVLGNLVILASMYQIPLEEVMEAHKRKLETRFETGRNR